jgi:uncharacterized protein (DUF342 family)
MSAATENPPVATAAAEAGPAEPGLAIDLLARAEAPMGYAWVRAGEVVARVQSDASDRQDVPRVVLGEGVALGSDGQSITAIADGRAIVDGGRLCVRPGQTIEGDIGLGSPRIHAAGALLITGNVADVCSITGNDSIQVDGVIEQASVCAAGDLCAVGGISGKHKGLCRAGRAIAAKYILNASVEAGGDVTTGMIAGSRVVCGGRLLVTDGPIVAGHVTAAGGVTCQTIGSVAESPTLIEVGIDEELRGLARRKVPEIQVIQGKARKIRDMVEPLMRNPRALTPQQKERATELLFQADELDVQTQQMLGEMRSQYERAGRCCEGIVRVQQLLHPGVTIRFPGHSATTEEPMHGPLRLLTRQIRGQTHVVVIYGENGAAHPLPTMKHEDDMMPVLHQLFHPDGSKLR